MASTVDEITIAYEDDAGTLLIKEIDKKILSRGAWATIMFKYQDLDKASGEYKAPKFSLRRFQKVNGEFRVKSKFNISSIDQATKIANILNEWIGEQ